MPELFNNFLSLTNTQPVSQYVPIPDAIPASGLAIQQKADTVRAKEDETENYLMSLHTVSDSPDEIALKKSQQQYKDKIQGILEKNHGLWSDMDNSVHNLSKEFNEDLQRGQIGAIKGRYDALQANLKEIDDAYKKGMDKDGKGISSDTSQSLKEMAMEKFRNSSVGERNEVNHYNGFNGIQPIREVDVQKELTDIMNTVKDGQISINPNANLGYDAINNSYFLNKGGTKETLSPDKAREVAMDYIKGRHDITDSIDQDNMIKLWKAKKAGISAGDMLNQLANEPAHSVSIDKKTNESRTRNTYTLDELNNIMPNAEQGKDYVRNQDGTYTLFTNRNAIEKLLSSGMSPEDAYREVARKNDLEQHGNLAALRYGHVKTNESWELNPIWEKGYENKINAYTSDIAGVAGDAKKDNSYDFKAIQDDYNDKNTKLYFV